MESAKEKGLSPERVMEVLKKKGTHVDLNEAKIIADFVKKIAHIAVKQYLRGSL
ncbi:MAG: hypothetical protein QHC79_10300 [Pseudosphingobacterium sp.]|nr:hypothetical protein [Pseudosphingobacterium sp.]